MRRPFWRLPVCWLGLCGHRPNSDDTGCWGECSTCGQRVGFVDRATLRAYADREVDAEVARIMAMTDEEVLAECRAGGEDPEAVAAEMRDIAAKASAR